MPGSRTIADQAAEIQRLQSQIDQKKSVSPLLPLSVTVLSGTIVDISGDVVTVNINLPGPVEDVPKLRKVKIDGNTIIYLMEQKDSVSIQKEILELQIKGAAPVVKPGYPAGSLPDFFYKQSQGARTDLKNGQSIIVTAGEDVRGKAAFNAEKIEIIVTSGILPARAQ